MCFDVKLDTDNAGVGLIKGEHERGRLSRKHFLSLTECLTQDLKWMKGKGER